MCCFSNCGFDQVDVDYEHESFNTLAKAIIEHPEVFEMDDFSRHNKSLNHISIKLSNKEGDSSDLLLNEAISILKLDSTVISSIRQQLKETKLRQFYRSRDTILFTVDGMLDNAWGFLYSENNLQMDSTWFDFHGHSVRHTKDINNHWKKVAIK